jgi:hypothetical protein
MSEKMINTIDVVEDPIETIIQDGPIKLLGEITLSQSDLEVQAGYLRESLVPIDYDKVRGTCGDERFRIGLLSGEEKVEARPSVFGGPNIHALYVSEGAGVYKNSPLDPTERLRDITRKINRNKVQSGGHEHCAAAAGFGDTVLPNIVANAETARAYAQANMSDYDDDMMTEVLGNFKEQLDTYKGWDGEKALVEILGDEAGEAIEKLADMPHKGRTLARQHRPGVTIDQTLVHNHSDGEDSFEFDDAYAFRIENASADGPEASRVLRLMRHAREVVLVGVALSVPNPELHQIDVK